MTKQTFSPNSTDRIELIKSATQLAIASIQNATTVKDPVEVFKACHKATLDAFSVLHLPVQETDKTQ